MSFAKYVPVYVYIPVPWFPAKTGRESSICVKSRWPYSLRKPLHPPTDVLSAAAPEMIPHYHSAHYNKTTSHGAKVVINNHIATAEHSSQRDKTQT